MEVDRYVEPGYGAQLHSRDLDRLIWRLAEKQHGIVSRRQLMEHGVGRRAIGHRIEQRRLHYLHRGVYAVGHRVLSREGRLMAAAFAGGPGCALRRRSAAALWGIRHWDGPREELAVSGQRRDRPGLRFHRCVLPPDEVTREDGIPVTTPARTLLDLASVLNGPQLERAINEAEVRRLHGVLSLEALVLRRPRVRGVGRLREVLSRLASGARPTRNDFEGAFFAFLDAHGLPRPDTNAIIEAGTRPYEADFSWPGSRLIAELDGRAAHGTRRAFEEDRARDRALLLAGWRTTRITWRQLHEGRGRLAADLATLLD